MDTRHVRIYVGDNMPDDKNDEPVNYFRKNPNNSNWIALFLSQGAT